MGIKLATNIDIGTSLPLDSREVVGTLQERNDIPSHVRYDGLMVYVKSEKKNYQLRGGIENSHWISTLSTGDGSGVDIESIYTKEEMDFILSGKADLSHSQSADSIFFDDGEDIQEKYDKGKLGSGSGTHIGNSEPEDKNTIWIVEDEIPETPEATELEQFLGHYTESIARMFNDIRELQFFAFNNINAGDFEDEEESEYLVDGGEF